MAAAGGSLELRRAVRAFFLPRVQARIIVGLSQNNQIVVVQSTSIDYISDYFYYFCEKMMQKQYNFETSLEMSGLGVIEDTRGSHAINTYI